MVAQRDPKHKKLPAKPNKASTGGNEKIKVQRETIIIPSKAKQRARIASNETLAETQKALRAAQTELKREYQARIQAEKALAKAQEDLAATRQNVEQERPSRTRRVSFVVRLLVDEHGHLGRTEIEHVGSSRKQNFAGLDGERLVAFMKACIGPVNTPKSPIPTTSSPEMETSLPQVLPKPSSD